jgi:hypothetical protein
MRSLVCVEYTAECQILFSVLNAAWAFRMRVVISTETSPQMALYIPRSILTFGAAFVRQAGNFWTLPLTYLFAHNMKVYSECGQYGNTSTVDL